MKTVLDAWKGILMAKECTLGLKYYASYEIGFSFIYVFDSGQANFYN